MNSQWTVGCSCMLYSSTHLSLIPFLDGCVLIVLLDRQLQESRAAGSLQTPAEPVAPTGAQKAGPHPAPVVSTVLLPIQELGTKASSHHHILIAG